MKGYRLPSLLAAFLLGALCAGRWVPRGRGDERTPPEQEIARLIRDLGSESFEVRQAATRRLLEYEAPPPVLRAALKTGDPEVVRRATRILREITRREESTALGKLTDLARRGEIGRFIEFLVRRPKWGDEEAAWQAAAELNGKLLDLEKEKFRRHELPGRVVYPIDDFRRYARLRRPKILAARRVELARGCDVVRAEHISIEFVERGLLVSSRGIKVRTLLSSIALTGGPIEAEVLAGPIIVSGGSVKCYNASGCLIIARGDVTIGGRANDCRIITSGSVHFLPRTRVPEETRRRDVEIKEHEPHPLGFVKWFDPARIGVTVEAAEGGVRVQAAGKAFTAAGLRAGDLLTALDGEAVKSPDDFRLLLRAKLADGDRMALAVRRAGKDLKITVRYKD